MSHLNDNALDKGFSKISYQYEILDQTSSLIKWMRKRVRFHLEKYLSSNSSILEINCGSGIDAVYLAKNGHQVYATDIATEMVKHVASKIDLNGLHENLSCGILSFKELDKLANNHYSHIFSNFGGLNCTSLNDLEKISNTFKDRLRPNGSITLVIMPKICIWEFLRIFKGNKNAFRRLKKSNAFANIEGERVKVYYHSASQVKKVLSNNFTGFEIENICFLGPTGNQINFPERHPFLFKFLTKFDNLSNKVPFLRGYGDYYIISAKKK